MKRIIFDTPEQLIEQCQKEEVSLVIEYRDEDSKQRQVILTGEKLAEAKKYLDFSKSEAYYRKDGIFYEVVAGWR